MANIQLIVYADLNCPFCYALHERLLSLGRLPEVSWRAVEHFPSVTYDVNDLKSQTELLHEVTELRRIAPEINVIIPPARPSSHIASAMLVEAEKIDREKASYFRTLIYRALWQEGQDFSNPKVLETLRIKADLPELSITPYAEDSLINWNDEWEKSLNVINVTEKIVIKPSSKNYEKKNNEVIITIDPNRKADCCSNGNGHDRWRIRSGA